MSSESYLLRGLPGMVLDVRIFVQLCITFWATHYRGFCGVMVSDSMTSY